LQGAGGDLSSTFGNGVPKEMRFAILTSCLCSALAFCTAAVAQDGLETTTELGITITPTDITDAIQQTQDFWGPVQKYISGSDFKAADPAICKKASSFFDKVHEGLYKRIFEGDEASARDLLDFLTARLRKYELYRRLRKQINNDAAMVALLERWERAHRDIHALAEDQRPARVQAILALMPEEMAALGLSAETVTSSMATWDLQAKCMARMDGTEAGKMMIGFEHEARQLDRPIGELVRTIACAADWTLIVSKPNQKIGRADFEKSWKDLAELRDKRLTVSKPVSTR
jgi:hypothetical protein